MFETTIEALGGFFFPARRRRLLLEALERSLPAELDSFSTQFRAVHQAVSPLLVKEVRPLWLEMPVATGFMGADLNFRIARTSFKKGDYLNCKRVLDIAIACLREAQLGAEAIVDSDQVGQLLYGES